MKNQFSDWAQLYRAVDAGKAVYWSNTGYRVVTNGRSGWEKEYLVKHHAGSTVGLYEPDYMLKTFFTVANEQGEELYPIASWGDLLAAVDRGDAVRYRSPHYDVVKEAGGDETRYYVRHISTKESVVLEAGLFTGDSFQIVKKQVEVQDNE